MEDAGVASWSGRTRLGLADLRTQHGVDMSSRK